jgi:hypothetical protein
MRIDLGDLLLAPVCKPSDRYHLLLIMKDLLAIERHQSQPPSEFLAMVRNLVPANERPQIEQLVLQKSLAVEKAEIVIDGFRSAEIRSELDAFDRARHNP